MDWQGFVSVASIIIAGLSAFYTKSNLETSKQIFKLSNVFELHKYWSSISQIDPEKPVDKDAVDIVNILGLTADLWRLDIVEKKLLMSHWATYKILYDQLNRCNVVILSQKKAGSALLTKEMRLVYKAMENYEEKAVETSKIQ